MRLLLACWLAFAAVVPASALASDDSGPPRLSIEEAQRRLRRGQENLRRHGLSLDPRHLEDAVEDYRAIVGRMPADADDDMRFDAPFALAFALARAEFPADREVRDKLVNEALDALAAAAAVNPEFPGLFVVEGLVRLKAGDPGVAADLITRGLQGLEGLEGLAPWQVDQIRLFGLLGRGRALMATGIGREDLSEKDFTAALEIAEAALGSPDAPRGSRLRVEVLNHLAAALLQLDYFQRCEEVLRILEREDPGNALHLYNLGVVKAHQQRYAQAVEFYRRATERNPRFALPRVKLAYILLKYPPGGAAPDVEGALQQIESYRTLVGEENDEYCACRGEAAFLRGRTEEAEKWFRKALGKNPRCRQALAFLVKILGRDPDSSPERKAELDRFVERLHELLKGAGDKGTMDAEKRAMTFC